MLSFITILLAIEIALFGILISEMGIIKFQPLGVSSPLKFTNAILKRFHFVFLLHEFRSRLIKHVISIPIKKRFRNVCRVGESEERFIAPKNLLVSSRKSSLSENVSCFNLFLL